MGTTIDETSDESRMRDAWHRMGGHWANNCWAVLKVIEGSDPARQPELLQTLCEKWELWDTKGDHVAPPDAFTEETFQSLGASLGPVVDAILAADLARGLSSEEFYRRLWKNNIHNDVFSTEKERAFALAWTLIDKRIPYFEHGTGLRMSSPEFASRARELYGAMQRIRFLLSMDFEQRTEEADLLLAVIDEPADRADRVVIMAQLIALAGDRGAGRQAMRGLLDD